MMNPVRLVVQRAELSPQIACFELRIPGENLRVVVAPKGSRLELGALPGKGRLAPLGSRKLGEVEGHALLGVDAQGALWLARGREIDEPTARLLVRRLVAKGSSLHLQVSREDSLPTDLQPLDLVAMRRDGEALLASLDARILDGQKTALRRRLARAEERLGRRAEHVMGDLDKLATTERLAALGPLFLAEASRAKRGTRQLTATDWSDGSPREVVLPLDPAKPPRDQLESLFRRAKRAKIGRGIAESRWEDATSRQSRLAALRDAVAGAENLDGLRAIADQARALAPKDFRTDPIVVGKHRQQDGESPPYRTYEDSRGFAILVGRGGEHNDALSFHVAKPHDLWLHAKEHAGAHVIVPLSKGKNVPAERLVDAAHLAAHFSEARGEALVLVQYTERRHLRKPRGSAPGFVVVSREKVLTLRIEPERTNALLATAEER